MSFACKSAGLKMHFPNAHSSFRSVILSLLALLMLTSTAYELWMIRKNCELIQMVKGNPIFHVLP